MQCSEQYVANAHSPCNVQVIASPAIINPIPDLVGKALVQVVQEGMMTCTSPMTSSCALGWCSDDRKYILQLMLSSYALFMFQIIMTSLEMECIELKYLDDSAGTCFPLLYTFMMSLVSLVPRPCPAFRHSAFFRATESGARAWEPG